MVEEYLVSHHKTDIMEILQDSDVKKHYSLSINFVELFEYDTNLGNNILKTPEETLEELGEWILHVQNEFFEQAEDPASLSPKIYIHARVYGLPACPELHRTVFPKNEDLNLFLQITGTVIRVTSSKMLEYQRPYICTKCKHIAMVEADYDQKYVINPPKKCLNPDECSGKNLINAGDLDADNCKDYQEIKIQEQSSKLSVGSMPASMWVTLEDDLVDLCKPGDDVTICGIVKRRWGPLVPGKRIEVELVLKANHIQVNNGQSSPSLITPEVKQQFLSFWEKHRRCPLEGRDLILKSFCPKLYGMHILKLAMAVVLAGGTHCKQGNEVGIQIRSEPHILLVGDPGTGKSQLLRYAAKIIPRSVLTTGVGTTSAGLTVAAMMEDGQWQLEGGALVLSDGGICCIDEFNSMKPHDRASIHEAMEQQTISVAKASMVCKLRTRCSILAATNPKGGHLDPAQPLTLNLALPSPLLSRFDMVFMLKDTYDLEWDTLVADYILSGKGINAIKIDSLLWSFEMLQQYFTIIRSFNPLLTSSTNRILSSYYQAQRRADCRNKARTTVRLLDSLVRISQAHARLMFHSEVEIMDALFAVFLIENSMNGECAVLSLDPVNVQAPCMSKSMLRYAQFAASVLGKLGLHDILDNEITALRNGYPNKSLALDMTETSITYVEASIELNDGAASSNFEIETFPPDAGSRFEEISCSNVDNSNRFEQIFTPNAETSLRHLELEFSTSADTDVPNYTSENTEKVQNDILNAKLENKTSKDVQRKPKFFADEQDEQEKPESENHISPKAEDRRKGKGKKRKQAKPQELKQSKSAKKNTLNDFQMLNLIRSANDDFDLNVLNFMDSEEINMPDEEDVFKDIPEQTNCVDESVVSQATKVKKEIRNKFTFKRKAQPQLKKDKTSSNENLIANESLGIIGKATPSVAFSKLTEQPTTEAVQSTKGNKNEVTLNEDSIDHHKPNLPLHVENNAVSPKCKLSQNTKSRQFREKFAFKPRNEPSDQNEQNSTTCDSENISMSQVPPSQGLFKSQDEDYDSLNFDL